MVHREAKEREKVRLSVLDMEKQKWKEIIIQSCVDAKTYKPYFDAVIDTLAQILETRDIIHKQFVDEGCQLTVIKHTDRSKQENISKNPLLMMEIDYNTQALKYWSELGLTARSLKTIQNGLANDQDVRIEDLLSTLENG